MMKRTCMFLLMSVILILVVGVQAENVDQVKGQVIPVPPSQWRDVMAQTIEDIGLQLDTPFVESPFDQQLYAPDPAPNWLVNEAMAANGALYMRQILVDENTPVSYYVAKIHGTGDAVNKESFDILAKVAIQSSDPMLTEAEVKQIIVTLTEEELENPNQAHFFTLRSFTYNLSLDKDGALIDFTIEYNRAQ